MLDLLPLVAIEILAAFRWQTLTYHGIIFILIIKDVSRTNESCYEKDFFYIFFLVGIMIWVNYCIFGAKLNIINELLLIKVLQALPQNSLRLSPRASSQ